MNGSSNRIVVIVAALVALVLGAAGGFVVSRLAPLGTPGTLGNPGSPMAGGDPAGGAPQGPPPAAVRVGRATQETLQQRFEVVGRLEEVRRATIAAEVEGKVIAAPVEEGDRVEAGETVLVRIDPVWARAALQMAEAQVASARAELDQSRRDLAYLEQLQAAGSAKPKEVDDARAAVASDEAELTAALAARDEAATRVSRLEVVAPFDGAVVEKMVEVGQWVQVGDPVAELISTEEIDAVVYVPERLINRVSVGERVEVFVEPLGEAVEGEVVAVVPSGASAARTFPVKVRLDDLGGRLKSGMSVLARLPVGESKPVLTVPRDAVLFQGGEAVVWAAVSPGGTWGEAAGEAGGPSGAAPPAMPQAMPMNVEVLFGVDERYAVQPLPSMGGAKLAAEMPVVIEGAEQLFPTQPLMILNENLAEAR